MAFWPSPFGGKPTQFVTDINIAKAYPALQLAGTELSSLLMDMREVQGSGWFAINAFYNGAMGGYQQIDSSRPSFAIVLGLNNLPLRQFTAPAGASTPIVWQEVSSTGGIGVAWFNVQLYGAKGDNSTDDHDAIMKAVNAMALTPYGGCLYFPTAFVGGTYLCRSAITITQPNQVSMIGDGQSSVITASGDFDLIVIPNTASHGTGFTMKDLVLQCATGYDATNHANFNHNGAAVNIGDTGVYNDNANGVALTDCRFYNITTNGFGYGLKYFGGGGRNVMYGCKWKSDYVGVWMYGHGVKCLGDTMNGGTYALVCDGGADPKIFECPLFGALCIVSINTTGKVKGGTFYLYDMETNFGPPPATVLTPATGSFLFGGTSTGGQTFTISISGNPVTVNQGGVSIAADIAAAIAAINTAWLNDPNNNDYLLVTLAVDGLNPNQLDVSGTGDPGLGGNKIKISSSSTGGLTVVASGATLTGGTDNSVWPGRTTGTGGLYNDEIGTTLAAQGGVGITNGPPIGCGGALMCGDHAQLLMYGNWIQDSVVVGTQATFAGAPSGNGPKQLTVVGGNYGTSVKGPSQISTHTFDVQALGGWGFITHCIVKQGANVANQAAMYAPAGAFFYGVGGLKITNNQITIANTCWAIEIGDNQGLVRINDNTIIQKNGVCGSPTGLQIHVTGIDSVMANGPFGNNGNIIATDNDGFNGLGAINQITQGTTTTVQYRNVWGIPTTLVVTGAGITLGVMKADGSGFQTITGIAAGTFRLFPGAPNSKIQVQTAGSAATITPILE